MISLSAKHIKNKHIGLMGAKKPYPVFFKTRFGIHTFFLKFPIDVLILDENNRVVKMAQNLKPNSIFVWNPKYSKVVELPAGAISKNKILVENEIKLIL